MAQKVALPNHIAIIPDGNRRWSKLHGVPKLRGHRAGAQTMHNVVGYLISCQLRYLTVWGFSTDNWRRNEKEVRDLMQVLASWIKKDTAWLNRNDVRLRHIGRLWELPDFLQQAGNEAMELTSDNRGMTLTLAFNYSGRAELIDAAQRLVKADIPSQAIDEKLFSRYLYDNLPDVDLVIRTAGEFRVSNFLLWQSAYSEYFFTESLWPDFTVEELGEALRYYSKRQRRFGGD